MLRRSLGGAAVASVCPCGDDWRGGALPRWLSLTVSRDGLSLPRAADCLGSARADLTCVCVTERSDVIKGVVMSHN